MANGLRRVFRNRAERLAIARSMNLFSTPFVRVVFKDKAATQHVLRVLTGIPDLVIEHNDTEYRVSKLDAHDAVLDVYARDGKGTVYHIEVQLSDNDDHILRIRAYTALIDSELLDKGAKYKDLPNAFIFYISMNDFMNLGEPIAEVNSFIGKKKVEYKDGKRVFFVNAAIDDDSDVAKLMDYFKLADPNDASQGNLSKRVHFLKCEPEGEEPMCAITQSFVEEGEIIGVVKYMRKRGATDNEILAEIKEEYGLDDFEAQSFVRGTIDQVVAV